LRVYSVGYDLDRPGQNYDGLIKELQKSNGWAHCLKSQWLIATWETAQQLYTRLTPYLDKNDSILVIEVNANYAGWLPAEMWQWIHKDVA
jgi:hypothetical protein